MPKRLKSSVPSLLIEVANKLPVDPPLPSPNSAPLAMETPPANELSAVNTTAPVVTLRLPAPNRFAASTNGLAGRSLRLNSSVPPMMILVDPTEPAAPLLPNTNVAPARILVSPV